MSKNMNKFSIESAYLVYALELTEEIDSIAVGMIGNNKIDHILPISFHQIDSQRYLRYNISSTVSLQKFLSGTLNKGRVLNMFRSICEAYLLTDEFLLDSAAFVLDPRYIFVEPAGGEANLVYLATVEERDEVDLLGFFKRLLISIKPDLSDGCSNVIGAILTYLNSNDHFSLNEFMKILQQQEKQSVKIDTQQRSRLICGETNSQKGFQKNSPSTQMPIKSEKRSEPPISQKEHMPTKTVPELNASEKEFEVPGRGKRTFEVPGGKKKVQTQVPVVPNQTGDEEIKLGWLLHNFSGENLARYRAQKQKNNPDDASSVEKGKVEESKKKKQKRKEGREYVLVLTSSDDRHPYIWVIDQPEFYIGRSKNNNHGILSGVSNNISRSHCKIVNENGTYFVVDLGSSFGTTLDGITCVANVKSPAIKEGSIIGLPEISFKATFSEK